MGTTGTRTRRMGIGMMKMRMTMRMTRGMDMLSLKMGREKELTCSQWTKAAFNYFQFQQEHDSEGNGGMFLT